jgi:hypothetical protein
MQFKAALQLWPDSICKLVNFSLGLCELGLSMCDGNEGLFETLERGCQRQNGKFGKCGLSGKGGGARRRTWSGGLPVGGPGEGWVHWHKVARVRTVECAESGRGFCNRDRRRQESGVKAKTGDHSWALCEPRAVMGQIKDRLRTRLIRGTARRPPGESEWGT